MISRKIVQQAALLGTLSFSLPAWANTFPIDYENQAAAEPDTSFDVDCGGAAEDEAADCAERAAALRAELVDLLTGLSGESDAQTVALFEAVSAMNDPQLQAIALRYFAAHQEPPTSLWDKAREFFFGPDAVVGHPSAELLKLSKDEIDQQLSEAYLKGRARPNHGGDLPEGAGFEDSWALGYAEDARLDDLASFTAKELFPDATRLLMLDRFIVDSFDPDADPGGVPVTAFASDATSAEIEAHFTSVFGAEPYPSLAELKVRETELTAEFSKLAMNFSDPAAARRFQEITKKLQENQAATLVGTRLGLASDEYADHVFWVTLPSDGTSTGPLPRAVTVGPDARLDSNVIRYINGAAPGDVTPPGGPASGSAGAGADDPEPGTEGEGGAAADANAEGGADDDDARATTKHDSGCSCRLTPHGSSAGEIAALALLAFAVQRRTRRGARSRQESNLRSWL